MGNRTWVTVHITGEPGAILHRGTVITGDGNGLRFTLDDPVILDQDGKGAGTMTPEVIDFRTPLQRHLGPLVETWGPVALLALVVILGLAYAVARWALIIKVLSW